MKAKIGILSYSQHFITLATGLAGEVDDAEILVKKTSYEEAKTDALEMESRGVEVILGRGEIARTVKEVVKVPVIKCRLTILDLKRNLVDMEPHMNCMISGQMFFSLTFKDICREIEKIMKLKLNIFNYETMDELQEILLEARRQNNIDMVFGGHIVHHKAQNMGLASKELLFSKETLLEIIYGARKIVLENRKIEKQTQWVKSVIDFTKQGIIAIDNAGTVTNLNQKARDLLGPSGSNLSGNNIFQYLPELKPTIEKRKSSREKIVQINKQKILLDFQPLYMQDQYIGGLISLETVHHIQKLEQKIRKTMTDRGLAAKFSLESIIGSSQLIKRTIKIARTFANTDFNILIAGETGTGKELFAQGVHLSSPRHRGPFVAVNCAALPENLLESELFGYEEGAFSGARKGGKLGLFELAHQGTIFLDEINSISLAIQSRLLRAIEEKEILRVGGDKIIPIDVRIVAATNEDLIKSVEDGGFRKDLYYRINELSLTIPPLRRRKEDIPELIHSFLKEYESRYKTINEKTEEYINSIIKNHYSRYHWPGNVRELSNLVKRCVVLLETMDEGEPLQSYFSEDHFYEVKKGADVISIRQGTLAEMEKELIKAMFKKYDYNKSELASKLNISRSTLWRMMKNS